MVVLFFLQKKKINKFTRLMFFFRKEELTYLVIISFNFGNIVLSGVQFNQKRKRKSKTKLFINCPDA